jgi:hypothetical protein
MLGLRENLERRIVNVGNAHTQAIPQFFLDVPEHDVMAPGYCTRSFLALD